MDRKIITLTEEGAIVVPDNPNRVRMMVIEIADLLGIYYSTAKRHIRAIEQSGITEGDYKMTCIIDTRGVHPEYYGLEMIAAIAFRVKSWQADKFRRWLMQRGTQQSRQHLPPIQMVIPVKTKTLLN